MQAYPLLLVCVLRLIQTPPGLLTPTNCFKINTDAAVNRSSPPIGIGVVSRIDSGLWVPFPSLSLVVFSAEMEEFLTLREGLVFAKSLGLKIWSAEVDAPNVASRISSNVECNDNAVNIVKDNRELCTAVGNCTCSHIPRKGNEVAHTMVAHALSSGVVEVWHSANPCISSSLV